MGVSTEVDAFVSPTGGANNDAVLDKLELGEADRAALVKARAMVLSSVESEGAAAERGEQVVVAIVDPPRSGLHPSVIRTLRATARIQRIVYVSCNPTETFVEGALPLCGPTIANCGK